MSARQYRKSVAYLDDDLYDRLATSVDGGPPAGVLNVQLQPER